MVEGSSSRIPLLSGEQLSQIEIEFGVLEAQTRFSIVMLNCPDKPTERAIARLLLATQDGQRAFGEGDLTYFGDQRIQVVLMSGPDSHHLTAEVFPQPGEGHLTLPFLFRDHVDRESVEVFETVFEVSGHYHLILGRRGRAKTNQISLIKYRLIDRTER